MFIALLFLLTYAAVMWLLAFGVTRLWLLMCLLVVFQRFVAGLASPGDGGTFMNRLLFVYCVNDAGYYLYRRELRAVISQETQQACLIRFYILLSPIVVAFVFTVTYLMIELM